MVRRKRLAAGFGVAAALFAGALGLALYLIGPTGSNSANACPLASSTQSLAPLATGEVAAFIVHDEPVAPPALSFVDAEGEARSLADWQGRAVLLNVWATWCAPCREEMPALDALQAAMGDDDFEVVAVSIDAGDASKPRAFLEEVEAENLAFYHDASTDTFAGLRAAGRGIGLPVTLLIGADGCERGYLPGPADWASEDARRLIGALVEPSE